MVSMTVHCITHTLFGGSRGPALKSGSLKPEQVAALRTRPSSEPGPETDERTPVALDDGDRADACGARPGRTWLDSAGLALAEHTEVAYACATTGVTNLYAALVCKDLHSLYTYLTTQVAALGVHRVETSPTMRTLKGPARVRALR
jgi:DNA-binding Lrp family transcriptional regulator